jgi:hypothetical protein
MNDLVKLFDTVNREAESHLLLKSKELLKDLVQATPIDTGTARAAWSAHQTSKNTVELSNSVEYIGYLNSGSSIQAPAYFIEKTALEYGVPHGAIVTPLT